MPLYQIRKKVLATFVIQAKDAQTAIEYAKDDYWDVGPDKPVRSKEISVLNFSVGLVAGDPQCSVNEDGKRCERDGSVWAEDAETWVCERHANMLAGRAAVIPLKGDIDSG